MALGERDPVTGYLTTGHEWNGIKELNTPVPRIVYVFLSLTTTFGLIYWLLMPALPLGTTYTKGLLGYDERRVVERAVAHAEAERAPWHEVLDRQDFASFAADPAAMQEIREAGRLLFGQNCAACHGIHATGNTGFPNLAAGALNWGDRPEVLQQTIRVGVNSDHPESRTAQMPAFGQDGILSRPEVDAVIAYVHDLSRDGTAVSALAHPAGARIFAAQCAACHGADARGKADVGAPNLTDTTWLYGGDLQTIFQTVWYGRQGHMPSWEARLGARNVKLLAAYVADLRTRQP
ncbi:cytochrome-c oxidase, cbb3-type subunit III [Rhizobium straminoryzae]|uniref:Cbb3-type cytochrome c oxidase subunit n=1 Tax=Rhizobium straminoryzae TaxID=1387186 RepID=A0A549T639_9HYPH|nr:cytochrome-c oxidase, cbb3-type subunit III [Rhizobium straminoryzae]TRL37345.1 cytochrome-c oxidase, cbb3-type subunit III [Rhizobium straminoryzae]